MTITRQKPAEKPRLTPASACTSQSGAARWPDESNRRTFPHLKSLIETVAEAGAGIMPAWLFSVAHP